MKHIVTAILASVLMASGVCAETLKGQGEATFSVKATGHTVHGTVALEPFEATVTEIDGDRVVSLEVEAEVLKMTTDKKKRDDEMYHVLNEESHPMIHGEASNISLAALKAGGEDPVMVPFTFKLAGVAVQKEAEVLKVTESDEGLEVSVGFDVSQQEHFLTPIRKFGFLKVKDTVNVEVHITLAP